MTWVATLFLTFVAALGGTALVRRFALGTGLLDHPNERSSHNVPTPSGGGLAIVLAYGLATISIWVLGFIDGSPVVASLVGGGAIAAIGFIDDRRPLSSTVRFAVQCVAVIFAMLVLEPSSHNYFGLSETVPAALVFVGIVLAALWLVNLFNFMDGIDGIASIEAITVSLGVAVLVVLNGRADLAFWPLTLAAACAGFLYWNWSPAKIFMGDVSSGFLGFVLAVMAIAMSATGAISILSWVILLGVFFTDATVTLLRRMMRGEAWYRAHRCHAYQHLAASWGHARVALLVAFVNMVWLWPVAWMANRWPSASGYLAIVAYLPLVFLTIRANAGIEKNSASPAMPT